MLAFKKYRLPNLAQFRRISTTTRFCSEEPVVHRDSTDNNAATPFEFTQANMTRLAAFINSYPEGAQRSVLGAALDIVQRQIGWVPISAMHKIAELLSIPRMRVYEFASFYTMYNSTIKPKLYKKSANITIVKKK
ncbi:hypothetical protein MSG28_011043 [Choristoneura fumiferana]|uniref:Uncharacterized protein n=1 Tax=Choristoneura fumiferana TaxID=7141 RepID=A0ACC0KQQ2_CHOFU|nr:hypothetical protein MSG28_011043 [Choristoneura fumiferana]